MYLRLSGADLPMTPKKQRRLAFAITLLLAGGGAAALAIYALGQNTQFFRSPTDLVEQPVPAGLVFRVGGLVAKGSVKQDAGLTVHFVVTDGKNSIPVNYSGVLPDLFREGQGVVAIGTRGTNGVFTASQILAKHDERYMPPEVVDALKRSGHWREGQTASAGS
jgi:cytochrome c-type biogenesis protein CcmE